MFGVHDIVTILLGKCAHRLNLIVCIVVVGRSLRSQWIDVIKTFNRKDKQKERATVEADELLWGAVCRYKQSIMEMSTKFGIIISFVMCVIVAVISSDLPLFQYAMHKLPKMPDEAAHTQRLE